MAKRDIIVIGASAGGIYALKELAATLPADLSASIFIVQHVAPYTTSYLPTILNFSGKLPASHAVDGESIKTGHIYVAPPDHHLLIEEDRVLVKKGPKENRFRPSIDALFRSAAYTYGPRVIGIVLTGLLDDGTSGMWSIKRLGGISVIQQPEEAMYPSMPESVQQHVEVDYVVELAQLAPLLSELIQQDVSPRPTLSGLERKRMETEVKTAMTDSAFAMNILQEGELTPLTCPQCHGSLVSIREGTIIRYRCHTGHAYTASSLLAEIKQGVEDSLWSAVRSLDEVTILMNQAAQAFDEGGNPEAAQTYWQKAEEAQQQAFKIRTIAIDEA